MITIRKIGGLTFIRNAVGYRKIGGITFFRLPFRIQLSFCVVGKSLPLTRALDCRDVAQENAWAYGQEHWHPDDLFQDQYEYGLTRH